MHFYLWYKKNQKSKNKIVDKKLNRLAEHAFLHLLTLNKEPKPKLLIEPFEWKREEIRRKNQKFYRKIEENIRKDIVERSNG